MRSGCSAASLPLALNSAVSASRGVDPLGGVLHVAGLDEGDRDRPDGGERGGQGERERAGAGRGGERGDAEGAERDAAAGAGACCGGLWLLWPCGCGGGGCRAGEQGRAERAEHEQQPGVGQQEGDAHQPGAADGGEREDGRVLPLGGAVEPPGAAEPLIGPDPLGDQPGSSAPRSARRARRGADAGGLSRRLTAIENGPHMQPKTAPISTTPGPISGVIHCRIAIR